MTFKVGDVVVLKSGGPRMTVEEIEGQEVQCVWFDKTTQKRGEFNVALLASGTRGAIGVRG